MPTSAQAERRHWRNVMVVRERDPRRLRWVMLLLLGVAAAATPVAAYLIQQMQFVETRYRIEELRGRRERLEETERRLRIERATLEALPRVEGRALDELGLVHPTPHQIVVVRSSAPGRGSAAPRAPGEFPAAR
ncbi:MAG: cell division protein FtsL [Acidobacteriia bacterium]|nr:cell division protein FtsL [Terriglobia bacterium]